MMQSKQSPLPMMRFCQIDLFYLVSALEVGKQGHVVTQTENPSYGLTVCSEEAVEWVLLRVSFIDIVKLSEKDQMHEAC